MKSTTITLDEPIVRGDKTFNDITLTKPEGCGWLRGVSVLSLTQMDATAISTVLPRISAPTLTTAEVLRMDAADFTQCAIGVLSFLLPKSALTEDSPTESKTPSPTLQ